MESLQLPFNTIYRGQVKQVDKLTLKRLQTPDSQEQRSSHQSGNSNQVSEDDKKVSVQHGYGVEHWADGAVYEGQWYFGKMEGQGTYCHPEGDIYRG